jgi:diguanylate cyclase (GGDEF)-like protein
MWNAVPIEFMPVIAVMGVALWIARLLGKSSQRAILLERETRVKEAQQIARDHRRSAVEATRRAESAEAAVEDLQRSLAELPEIAQRLSGTRNLREIPNCAIELVQEIFDPSYALFYKCVRDGLVAVSARGRCEYGVGHRLEAGRGIVGWAALKQLPLTPEEIEYESGVARGRSLSEGVPDEGFAFCLPVVRDNRTLGVMLIGPCARNLRQARDLGRTIALMTSVAITSALVFKEQEQLAQTDGLTGLLNKSRIVHYIDEAIAEKPGPRNRGSVFLFDIDHFKHYNDTNGHVPGDDLLRSLGKLLNESLREGEYVGRYGGEEFLLVMPEVEKTEALKAAERIRSTIAEHAFHHREQQPLGRISISGGIASWPADGSDVELLIRCADEALYEAKRGGRDRVISYYPPDLSADGETDLSAPEDLDFSAPEEAELSAPEDLDFSADGEADLSAPEDLDFSAPEEAELSEPLDDLSAPDEIDLSMDLELEVDDADKEPPAKS